MSIDFQCYISQGLRVILSSDQVALRMVLSVHHLRWCSQFHWRCPSVCPSVCDTLFIMFLSLYYDEIFRSYFTIDRNNAHANVYGQRSKSQRSKQFFIPIKIFPDHNSNFNSLMVKNDIQGLKWHRRGTNFFQCHQSNFKITQDTKMSILTWIECFLTAALIKFTNSYGM